MLLLYLMNLFAFSDCVHQSDVDIITNFYQQWDLHSSLNNILTFICDDNFTFKLYQNNNQYQLTEYYLQYIKSHINEQHSIQSINLLSSNSLINSYLIYLEYTSLQWNYNRSYTLCVHYNYTIMVNITSNSDNHCIQSLQVIYIRSHFVCNVQG